MSPAMNDDIVPCVNGIIKAFHKGTERTQKICNAAARSSSPAEAVLEVVGPTQALQRALAECESRVQYAYSRSVSVFGRKYPQEISADRDLENRLQGLTINLQEQLESLGSYFEDPISFDLGSLSYIQKTSERCCDQTIQLLGDLHVNMEGVRMQQYKLAHQDDRTKLPSQNQPAPAVERPISQVSPMSTLHPQFPITVSPQSVADAINPHDDDRTRLPSQHQPSTTVLHRPPLQASPMNNGKFLNYMNIVNVQSSTNPINPQSFAARAASVDIVPTGRINIPSYYDNSIRGEVKKPTGPLLSSYKEAQCLSTPRPEAPGRSVSESDVVLIDSEEVVRHATSIENFLAKRKQSRAFFQHEIEHLRQLSLNSTANSTSTTSPHPSVAHPSPRLMYTEDIVASPISNSRPNSTLLLTRSQSREGHNLSPGGLSNRNSATLSPSPQRQISSDSEGLIMYPDSPPISSGRQSANDVVGWGLARASKFSGLGEGVEDEKEVVNQGVSDTGMMLVSEIHDQPTPATSVQSIEYPITHDTSFYKYHGFCSGAKMILQGQAALKVIKKPGAHLTAFISMKCVECKYEIDFDVYDKDNFLDKAGIYSIGDIAFRQRFLSKCHLPARHTDDSFYACLFCIEESKTVDDYDATVFFSVNTLFRHLQKHTRPVKGVEGIIVEYGPNVDNLDFDIHFKTMDPKPSPFINIGGSFKDRPTAHAILDHHKRSKGYRAQDLDGRPTLQFAIGARIVGITYSDRSKGEWCHGYHDGDQGYFPAALIALDPPPRYDVTTSHNSRWSAVAKWEYKPKESNPAWLTFGKKDKITNIGFPYPDAWCWSGRYKDKWGLFPACFVEGLKEEPGVPGRLALDSRKPSADSRKPSGDDSSPKGGHHFSSLGGLLKRRTTDKSMG